MAHKRWKGVQCIGLSHAITGQGAFNALLRCLFTLSGTGKKPVPSVAALSGRDTRPGQRGRQLRWRRGRVFTKICMPPRRCLASWPRNHVSPRGCLPGPAGRPPSWGGKGLPQTCFCSWQGSCRGLREYPTARGLPGLRGVFGKDPCRGLVGVLGKEPCDRHVFWFLSWES